MSPALEGMFHSMLLGRVPENWAKVAYPSLKPLASWYKDLLERVVFFKEWVAKDVCETYWVSALFFP